MAKSNYKWDGDSRDERQSVFAHSGYSTTSASEFHSTLTQRRKPFKRKKRLTLVHWALFASTCVSALLIYGAVVHLHG
jgi:hypothetical protein